MRREGEGRGATSAVTIALALSLDLDAYRAEIAAGLRPRHVLLDLADRTSGQVLTSADAKPRFIDRLGARLIGSPEMWWLARATVARAAGGPIYTNNEAIGVPIVLWQALEWRRSWNVGFWVMTPDGRRTRPWLRMIHLMRLRPFLVAETQIKARALRRLLGRSARITHLEGPIDLSFFSPGDHPRPDRRPGSPFVVASAGLEQRDYRTLAEALDGLVIDGRKVEVVICAVSPDASSTSAALPDEPPPTLRFVDLDMVGLRDLYRAADVVVVPTLANTIGAGSTSVAEAMACGAAVVASAQAPVIEQAAAGSLRASAVGSAADLRAVLTELLSSPERREQLGRRARRESVRVRSDTRWVDAMVARIHAPRRRRRWPDDQPVGARRADPPGVHELRRTQ